MKSKYKIVVGLCVSVLFIYLAFRRVELSQVHRSLSQANYWWILPNMAAVIVTMMLRATRWHHLLKPVRSFRFRELFPSVMIGFMANNVLPVRLGEVVRAYSLGTISGESRSSIFATVVLERVFDSLTLLTMFWIVILFIPVPLFIKRFGVVTLGLDLVLIGLLVLLRTRTDLVVRVALNVLRPFPARMREGVERILLNFARGLGMFKDSGIVYKVAVWSVVIWVVTALSNYFVFMSFDIYPPVTASFILLLFVAAAVTLPSAPGFVGVFHAAAVAAFAFMNNLNLLGSQFTGLDVQQTALIIPGCALSPVLAMGALSDSLGLFGISKAEALSFSIVLWLCQFVPVTVLGFYYLKRKHLTLKTARE